MKRTAILLKLSEGELAAIDRVRGGVSRSAWIRELCAAGAAASNAHGRAGALRVVVDDGELGRAPGVEAPRPRRVTGVIGVSAEAQALAAEPESTPRQITVDEALAS